MSIAPEVLRACGFKAGDIAIILSFSKRPFEEDVSLWLLCLVRCLTSFINMSYLTTESDSN